MCFKRGFKSVRAPRAGSKTFAVHPVNESASFLLLLNAQQFLDEEFSRAFSLFDYFFSLCAHRKSERATKKVDLLELQEGKNASRALLLLCYFQLDLEILAELFPSFFQHFSHCDVEEDIWSNKSLENVV